MLRKIFVPGLPSCAPYPGSKFWGQLDDRLDGIRKAAAVDAQELIIRAFRFVLTQDQDKQGSKGDYELDEKGVNEFQQKVDDMIGVDGATAMDIAYAAASSST
ncbi:hypothetical protein R3P38DRAFT_3191406 [Favolaschia claudopus]|uniref:Uncharacterized protein n=1 Tax=Favolaschia claudopus TaxID=2862362 RepID=A0AAW0BP26_9AGAR